MEKVQKSKKAITMFADVLIETVATMTTKAISVVWENFREVSLKH